jgi:hypothetical protein
MKIRVIREPSLHETTLGCLFLDGRFLCFTLEDQIREVDGQPVATWKVPGSTAIPAGRYTVVITQSHRFQRRLPLLLDVEGFSGIRIHPGNVIADTSGCLLVGNDRADDRVRQSRLAFEVLYEQIADAIAKGEPVTIDLENPQP